MKSAIPKVYISQKWRYTLAIAFILLPTAAMGVFGSWALNQVDAEHESFKKAASNVAKDISNQVFNEFADSLRLEVLVPGVKSKKEMPASLPQADPGDKPVHSTLGVGEYELLPSQAYHFQKEYFSDTGVNRFALAVMTYRGDTLLHVEARGGRESDLYKHYASDDAAQGISSTFRPYRVNEKRRSGYLLTIQQGMKQGVAEREILHFAAHDEIKSGVDNQYWTAWILDTDQLESALQQRAQEVQVDEPLKFRVIKQSDVASREQEDLRFLLPLGEDLLGIWLLAVSVDTERLPIQQAEWRSTFYTIFAFVVMPLLGVILWIGVAVIRREIEYAKKKVDFVANVSHELKTPLTSIRLWIETLLLGRVKSERERQESLQIVLRESERLSRLIDRVLQFNKLERDMYQFQFQLLNLGQILRDTIKVFRTEMDEAQERSIKLVVEPGMPKARVDLDSIREVILNLLSNAVKYSDPGTPVYVRLYESDGWIQLDVVDQGFGISSEHQDRIFEKFYRVDDALNRAVSGSGLGLAISRQIIDAHGGDILVESSPKKGSRFIVKLPIEVYERVEDPMSVSQVMG